MAGRPLRRARLAAAEHARQLRLRGGEEPDPPDYFATLGAEPVRQVVVPPPPSHTLSAQPPQKSHTQRATAALPPPPEPPPMSAEEAQIFTEARLRALKLTRDFLNRDLSQEYDAALRAKLELKQIELAQGILTLGGRIDPGVMRGQQTDEVGEMLASIKGGS